MSELEAFAADGAVGETIETLLMASSCSQWLEFVHRVDSDVREFVVVGLPPAAWSTGERMLWDFARSVAGQGTVNLYQFLSYFKHSPLRPQIHRVWVASLGVQ